MSVGVTQVGYQ